MSEDSSLSWPEANERYLMATVDVVRAVLENHAARLAGREPEDRSAAAPLRAKVASTG